MTKIPVKFKRLSPDAVLPTYATAGSAAFDLYAATDVIIEPGETAKIPLGFAVDIPPGYAMFIVPRSGVSLWTKLRIPNKPAVIDSDYRGEVAMMFDNILSPLAESHRFAPLRYWLTVDGEFVDVSHLNPESYTPRSYIIRKGDRIAQAFVLPVPAVEFIEVDTLDETERGDGGFGSTGVGSDTNDDNDFLEAFESYQVGFSEEGE